MLTIATTPISSRINAVISVSDTGNLLSPWMRPAADHLVALLAQVQHELDVVDDADRPA